MRYMCVSGGEVDQGTKYKGQVLLCGGINLNRIVESRHDKLFCRLVIRAAIVIPEVIIDAHEASIWANMFQGC